MGNAKYMDRHSEVKLLTQVKDRNYTDGKITDYDEEGEREIHTALLLFSKISWASSFRGPQ